MRIAKFVVVTFLIFNSGLLFAQQYDSIFGKPFVVLTETNPTVTVGNDEPILALYENGQIIYKTVENKKVKFMIVALEKKQAEDVMNSFSIKSSVHKLPAKVIASQFSDQPSNLLYLDLSGGVKTIRVYGNLNLPNGEGRKKTPKDFLTVFDNIKSYKSDSAKTWVPDKIELLFWSYDYATTTKNWPKNLPDLNTAGTVARAGGTYSVFMDKKDFEAFKKFYYTLSENDAVEINGKKMAVAYRFPFPNLNNTIK